MKKILTSSVEGTTITQEFSAQSLDFLQLSYTEILNFIVKSKAIGAKDDGKVYFIAGNTSFAIDKGTLIYCNGEIYLIRKTGLILLPAVFNLISYNSDGSNSSELIDPTKLSNGLTANVHLIREAQLVTGSSGTGTLTGDANSDFANVVFTTVVTANIFNVAKKILPIGTWNMTTTSAKIIPHGLSATEYKTIAGVDVTIINDAGDRVHKLDMPSDTPLQPQGHIAYIDSTNVNLECILAGFFSASEFSTSSANRGFISIEYISD